MANFTTFVTKVSIFQPGKLCIGGLSGLAFQALHFGAKDLGFDSYLDQQKCTI